MPIKALEDLEGHAGEMVALSHLIHIKGNVAHPR